MALAVARVANGLSLYVPPNFHFAPYMYSPGYFFVSACVANFLGPGLLPLRLVSILCTIGCLLLIAVLVFSETRNRLAALAGAGLYASAYYVCLYWFDEARVDSLFVFLVLLAIIATRRLHPAVAALVWTCAFLTKQSIIPVAIVALCVEWKRPRRVLAGLGMFLLGSIGSSAWLNHTTHGWFRYYVFTEPGASATLIWRPTYYLGLLAPFSVALIIVAAALVLTEVDWANPAARFYLCLGAALVPSCWVLTLHFGSMVNAVMPAYALLAVFFGVAMARLLNWLHGLPAAWAQTGLMLLMVAACTQFISCSRPQKIILFPTSAVRASRQQFQNWLRSVPGDVLVFSHPYESVMAGKPAHPDEFATVDALAAGGQNIPLMRELHEAIEHETLEAIVIDRTPQEETRRGPASWLPADWLQHYPIVGIVPGSDPPSDPENPLNPDLRYVLLPCRAAGMPFAQSIKLVSSPVVATCDGAHSH